jgi:hypothetical protein
MLPDVEFVMRLTVSLSKTAPVIFQEAGDKGCQSLVVSCLKLEGVSATLVMFYDVDLGGVLENDDVV